MVKLTQADMRTLEDALDMGSGYVLDFSKRTMSEFFEDKFNITIFQERYASKGSSKANHIRAFVDIENEYTVARVLRALWDYRESLDRYRDDERSPDIKKRFFALVTKIEGRGAVPQTDAIDRFKRDETLDELIDALNRDIGANRPAAALDRLHTYCMMKFGHLLEERRVTWQQGEPLHSRVGKYVKALSQERKLRDITGQIIKNAIGIFDKFNYVRNNHSLAHDNELIDPAEARFIYDTITAFLRFIKTIEADRFGA